MTRNCYSSDEWSLTECSKNCCGSSGASCFATHEGGHCMKDGMYYKYQGSGDSREQIRIKRTDALAETPYQKRPGKEPDWPTTNWYNKARYRDMKRRVLHDIRNEKRNVDILQHKDRHGSRELDFDYKKTAIPSFVTVIAGLVAVGLFIGLLYVLHYFINK